MCPMYDYRCSGCREEFEDIVSYESRDMVSCPSCGSQCVRKVSGFSFKMYNPFTKDGEGFSSVKYPVKEADIRNKYSVPKGVSV